MATTEPRLKSWVVGAVLAGVNLGLGIFMAVTAIHYDGVWAYAAAGISVTSCFIAGTTTMYTLLMKGRMR